MEEKCKHEKWALRKRVHPLTRTPWYSTQCLLCGCRTSNGSLTTREVGALLSAGHKPTTWDEEISRRYWQQCRVNREAAEQAANAEWWSKYETYLDSAKWHEKRRRVLDRAGGRCEACLQRTATQVHHTTYLHVFDEPLFDLRAVCDVCHAALHPDEEEQL
jgi:hypothetical protein